MDLTRVLWRAGRSKTSSPRSTTPATIGPPTVASEPHVGTQHVLDRRPEVDQVAVAAVVDGVQALENRLPRVPGQPRTAVDRALIGRTFTSATPRRVAKS